VIPARFRRMTTNTALKVLGRVTESLIKLFAEKGALGPDRKERGVARPPVLAAEKTPSIAGDKTGSALTGESGFVWEENSEY